MIRIASASVVTIGLMLSSCSQEAEGPASAEGHEPEIAEVVEAETTDIAEEPIGLASSECDGFVDGSSRPWTLAGIALGDNIGQVRQQLRCGDLVFNLTDRRQGYKTHIQGRIGEEEVNVYFVGLPGAEQITSVTRYAYYSDGPASTVNSLINSAKSQFPGAKTLEYGDKKAFGIGVAGDDSLLLDAKAIHSCAASGGSEFANRCKRAFFVHYYESTQVPGLLKTFTAYLGSGADSFAAVQNAKREFKAAEVARQVGQAGEVKGF